MKLGFSETMGFVGVRRETEVDFAEIPVPLRDQATGLAAYVNSTKGTSTNPEARDGGEITITIENQFASLASHDWPEEFRPLLDHLRQSAKPVPSM